MGKEPRTGLARRIAREYVVHLLLDPEEHCEAFVDSGLTLAEQAEAHRELKRIAGRLLDLRGDDA